MGSLRTYVRCIFPGLTAFALAASVPAAGRAEPDLMPIFSVCAGRMSAFVEHHWLLQQDPTEVEAERDAMFALLDAVLDPADTVQAMAWRIEAKVATRAMLTRADLMQNAAAHDRVAALIDGCRALILAPGV